MADYPADNSAPWGAALKAYIDEQDDETPEGDLKAYIDAAVAAKPVGAKKSYVDSGDAMNGFTKFALPTLTAAGGSLHTKPAFAQTFPRYLINGNVGVPANSMNATLVRFRKDQVVHGVGAIHTAAAVNTTRYIAIYDTSYAKLAEGTDTSNWSNGDAKVISLASPWTVPDEGYYYVAFHSGASLAHSLAKSLGSASGANAVRPFINWTQATIATPPATATPTNVTLPLSTYFFFCGDDV